MHIDHMSANPKAILIATILSTHRFCGARTHRERPAAPAWLALATLATVFSIGCSGSGASSGAGPDSVSTRAAVESATTAFHQALRTNDTATFLSYVADDVRMMPPGEAPVVGKAAVRAWYAAFLTQYRTSSLTLGDREVFVGTRWATELGKYEWGLTPAGGGATVVDRGHYMQVWSRQPNGQWRFAREIWNSAVPAPATEGK
jgi:ketosteroid isomerase-like protein